MTLRALEGEPLNEARIREMVVANAHAIAERQGIAVLRVTPLPDRIEVTLETGRVQAIGFAAELRRVTTNWYRHKFDNRSLWGDPPPEESRGEEERDDEADWWKNA